MVDSPPKVFISYGKEDYDSARRIYDELKKAGAEVFLDTESILPGQRWRQAIKKGIKESNFFIALLSSRTVTRRGYVQKEIKEALDVLDEFPEEEIYIIPVRLDPCEPSHERLKELQWVDLFPEWESGFQKILKSLNLQGLPPTRINSASYMPFAFNDLTLLENIIVQILREGMADDKEIHRLVGEKAQDYLSRYRIFMKGERSWPTGWKFVK